MLSRKSNFAFRSLLLATFISLTTSAPASAQAITPCTLSFSSPLSVALTGPFGGMVVDKTCTYVYLTNTNQNRVEVFSLATLSLIAPIPVGSKPAGLDITPDGALMYVANSGGSNISVIDLATRTELRRITVPTTSNDRPYSIAIGNNGLALFSTTFDGSGFGARMMQLTLATDAVSHRTDFYFSGLTTEVTVLRTSRDRSTIGIIAGDISSGPVFRYSAAANTFAGPTNLSAFVSDVSLDATGSTLFVNRGGYVLDASLNLSGTITMPSGYGDGVLDPTRSVGYRVNGGTIDVVNTSTLLRIGEIPIPSGNTLFYAGRMAISPDGSLVVASTDLGFSLVRPALPNVETVRNGDFAGNLTGWTTFATPDLSNISANVSGSVLEFYRVQSGANQAAVYQETGLALASGAPVEAQFDLGNSSTVRKRISVLLVDSNFSDLHVCTFWLPPGLPLTPFGIRTHTTKSWSNTSIYFYAATAGSDGGAYQLDNVSVKFAPAQANTSTVCVDPLVPTPPGGVAEASLLGNGDFSTGSPAPWSVFGTLNWQVASGVFQFNRPTSAPPAGVILQGTNQPMVSGQILTSTFQLGNSSSVRKRVTVLIQDADFSDFSACTFWLAPNQALATYTYRTYTTKAWANATIAFYSATIGAEQWMRLDNVTLQRTPGAALTGTLCIEPGGIVPDAPLPTWSWLAPTNSRVRTQDGATNTSGERTADGFDDMPADAGTGRAWTSGATSDGRRILEWDAPVDLTDATHATLSLRSWLLAQGSRAEVQISVDGQTWDRLAGVSPSDTWIPIVLDLSGYRGSIVRLRFVFDADGYNFTDADIWRIADVEMAVE